MVVRRSIYGAFLGCSNYPKCRNNEKLAALPETGETEEQVDDERDATE